MEGIDSLFVTNIEMPDENLPEAFLATVGAVYDDGLSLILEGQTEATTKHYKCNTSATFAAGDRVKVARISGSYIVEYVVGPPGSGGSGGESAPPDRIKKIVTACTSKAISCCHFTGMKASARQMCRFTGWLQIGFGCAITQANTQH